MDLQLQNILSKPWRMISELPDSGPPEVAAAATQEPLPRAFKDVENLAVAISKRLEAEGPQMA